MAINLSEEIKMEEWVFFLTGGNSLENPFKNYISWLPDKSWDELCKLDKLSTFEVFDRQTFINIVFQMISSKILRINSIGTIKCTF